MIFKHKLPPLGPTKNKAANDYNKSEYIAEHINLQITDLRWEKEKYKQPMHLQ